MRISSKRLALSAGLGALALSVAPLVSTLGPAAHAACANNHSPSAHTADPENGGTYVLPGGDPTGLTGGGLYTSGGDPTAGGTSGYVGGDGSVGGQSGYAEAGGDATSPTSGYVTSTQGGVENGAPC